MVGLAIGDMIAQRGWNTMNSRLDGTCASSCALIWLSGYSSHMIADWNSMIGFHSCYDRDTNLDDTACDAEIARHLVNYGFTPRQANVLAYISPHEQMTRGTTALAAALGVRWQTLPGTPGDGDYCQARLCVRQPIVPMMGAAIVPFLFRRWHR
jgi:hypothetical protein